MANDVDSRSCTSTCWIVSALAGVVIAALLLILGDWSWMQAIFAGILAAIILGFLLSRFMCTDAAPAAGAGTAPTAPAAGGTGPSGAGAGTGAEPAAAAPAADPTPAPAAAPAAAAAATPAADTRQSGSKMQPSKALAGQAELASRKGEWKYQNPADAAKGPKAAEPAATATASPDPAAPAPASKAKRTPVASDGKPETLSAPRAGGADDLKLISGVGPKLEGTLNEMGFWHFEQIAGWRKKEVEWVDSRLTFKGRILRDDWMSQAKILAKGGETEFSKKKKK